MVDNYNDVNRFWVNFREAVIENGIAEKYADWYLTQVLQSRYSATAD